ncbi:hypothetical protein [Cupriavidus necator]|uniref:hypothetical protein n=1 Tax=Cupriavidus necator TaxID=106590 RepID=UPI001D02C411|nr:hypothetical protein [Cupriavidus necator]
MTWRARSWRSMHAWMQMARGAHRCWLQARCGSRVARFVAPITRRGVPTALELTLRPRDHTVLRVRTWPVAA